MKIIVTSAILSLGSAAVIAQPLIPFIPTVPTIDFPGACLKGGAYLPNIPDCSDGDYVLAFEDNFNGTTLDLTKWQLQAWGQGALYGYNEGDPNDPQNQEYNSLNNVVVSDGTCKIIAKREDVTARAIGWMEDTVILDDGLPNLRPYHYTASNLWTIEDGFYWGRYEIRCRVPEGRGFWPSFWTFGGPRWNEIDFFELHGSNINGYTCNIHYDYHANGSSEGCGFTDDDVVDFSQWHTFTCDFSFDRLIWYIDGNVIRDLPRFVTVAGHPIYCGDDIGAGTFMELQAFPREDMNIIISMGVQKYSEAPDENTPFPSTFEIDYVRFWERAEDQDCVNCLDHVTYENVSALPAVTRVSDNVTTNDNVVVGNGQHVAFKAQKSVDINPGFNVEHGGVFDSRIELCGHLNYQEIPVQFISHSAVDGVVEQCIETMYSVNASGITSYSYTAVNSLGQIVRDISGEPLSNQIDLWNTFGVAVGFYECTLTLRNCADVDERNYSLYVDGCEEGLAARPIQVYEEAAIQTKSLNQGQSLGNAITLFPNPTKGVFNLKMPDGNERGEIKMLDPTGKVVRIFPVRSLVQDFDMSGLAKGIYFLEVHGQNGFLQSFRLAYE